MKELPIKTEMWNDTWFWKQDIYHKAIWMFFLSNPIVNIGGALRIAPGILASYCSMEIDKAIEVLDSLMNMGKIVHWDNYVYVLNWAKYHSYNPNTAISAKVIVDALPAEIHALVRGTAGVSQPLGRGSDAHKSKSNSNSSNKSNRDIDTNNTKSNTSEKETIDWKLVMEKWNEIAGRFSNIKAISKLSDSRKLKYKTRLKAGLDFLKTYPVIVERISDSSFLKGEKTNWALDFKFLFRSDDTFLKVIEGGFDDVEQQDDNSKF